MILLALDLAGVSGWAAGAIEHRQPEFGHARLKVSGFPEEDRFVRCENLVLDLCERFKPDKVVIEAPLPLMAQTTDKVARQQYGLNAAARMGAARAGLRCEEYSADMVRGELLGRTRFPKGEVKRLVLDWVKREGYVVNVHDEADAIALWTFYARQMRMGYNITPGMLIDREAA
jgi:Holliday junction resolvasome RuvABC endonuclease subunit